MRWHPLNRKAQLSDSMFTADSDWRLFGAGCYMAEEPFTISVPDDAIDDLHRRLRHTRCPDTVIDSGWTYGLDLDWASSFPKAARIATSSMLPE